jgi:hypothetical protein
MTRQEKSNLVTFEIDTMQFDCKSENCQQKKRTLILPSCEQNSVKFSRIRTRKSLSNLLLSNNEKSGLLGQVTS